MDGEGRIVQTQSTPALTAYTGRLITDTVYDSQGRVTRANSPWYNDDTAPSTTPFLTTTQKVPAQTYNVYDGLGRAVTKQFVAYGVTQTTTTTAYPGADRTDVTPPAGATPTSTVTDARGHKAQLWQYKTATATGNQADADVTSYTYTADGHLATQKDAAGNTWTHGYDLRGREVTASDPDTGTATKTYDAAGRLAASTDARNQTIAYTYDLLGRMTGTYSGSVSPDHQLTGFTYDTVVKGKPATSTRYVNGASGIAYTSSVLAYDTAYHPTKTTTTIPGTEIGQGTTPFTYTYQAIYDPITGALATDNRSAVGDIAGETLVYKYDNNGPLRTYGTSTTTYDLSSDWDAYGRSIRATVNPWGTQIVVTNTYDESTGRPLSQFVDKQTASTGTVQQLTYAYNTAGQLTAVRNIPDNTPSSTDLQCFGYDYLGRLTSAWSDTGTLTQAAQPTVGGIGSCANATPTSGAQAPMRTTVGGPAAYWQSHGYDLTGNRTQLVQRDPSGDTTKDTTTNQTFPATGTVNTPTTAANTGGPHALTGTTTTAPSGTTGTSTQYDAAGNTTAVTDTSGTATLTWNSENKLASYTKTGTAGPTTYLYDAAGNQLIRRDPGKTTITLGGDELVYDSNTNTVTGVRYYQIPGGVTLVRQGGNTTYQISDHHGTGILALDGTTLTKTRRPADPFGNPRGNQPTTWAGDHGFIGGTKDDATGLTNLGARQYDPVHGRFISPDPVLDQADPQQWNGYAYSNNNPANLSDPSGLHPEGVCGGFGTCEDQQGNIIHEAWHPNSEGGWNVDYWDNVTTKVDHPYHAGNDWSLVRFHRSKKERLKGFIQLATTFLVPEASPVTALMDAHDGDAKGAVENLVASKVEEMAFLKQLAFKLAPKFGGCSFDATTPVLMADGSTREISKIKPGDQVQAADPQAGEDSGHAVSATWKHDDNDLVDVTVRSGDRKEVIHTTSEHPFWDATAQKWIPATDLQSGHTLKTENGQDATVEAIRQVPGEQAMYNLTVADVHTYYALAGATPVLVHNSCGTKYYENRYGATDNRGLSATLEDGMVEMTLRAKKSNGERYEGVPRGSEMFQEALNQFGGADKIKGITASWNEGDLDTNLKQFNELIRGGHSEEDAARGTWTGGQAGMRGWTSVHIDQEMSVKNPDGTFREAMVYFTRSE
ncbi:polymorphic toxin-type HINT domain-containing protein [Kitasatospora sp. NPDC004669]|uniref:polymorphic toxin-type HINT domain-containing protein n=1 Tax=Kitasatospora sp. NPDC004669 TaxID=3154555 RepID=UPI00339E1A9F